MSAPRLKLNPESGVWFVHWSEGRRSKRLSTRQTTKRQAELFFAEWLRCERDVERKVAARTADLWALYRERHVKERVVSQTTVDYCWQNLEPHFGRLTPAEITEETIAAYGSARAAGRIGRPSKPSTVRRELVALLACYNWAADRRRKLISADDIPPIDLPENGAPRERVLTDDELRAAAAAVEATRQNGVIGDAELFFWIGLETGARAGAICDLAWSRIDFAAGAIDFRNPERRATKKRRAVAAISSHLRLILTAVAAQRPGEEKVIRSIWTPRDSFRRAMRRAGLGFLTPNVLRHTAATNMLNRDVSRWRAARQVGNSPRVLDANYAKQRAAEMAAAAYTISGGVVAPRVGERRPSLFD